MLHVKSLPTSPVRASDPPPGSFSLDTSSCSLHASGPLSLPSPETADTISQPADPSPSIRRVGSSALPAASP